LAAWSSLSLALRSVFWTLAFPGTIAFYIPWRVFGFRFTAADAGQPAGAIGLVSITLGAVLLATCIVDFARAGRGTLSPVDPPRTLVVRGLYRYVRNPMYLSVSLVVLGEALAMRSAPLAAYWALFFLLVNVFVIGFEEPMLQDQFGDSYAAYRKHVGRWIPRVRGWSG
jgi:protein-S-isoprenylcysteine O-methyltransferase Ste14